MPRHLMIAFLVATSVFAVASGSAKAKSVDCLLEVDGKRYIDGTCSMSSSGPGRGSFEIASAGRSRKGYRALVEVGAGQANGFWNGDIGVTDADVPLGVLRPSGACWTNARARVCAWKIGEPRYFVETPPAPPSASAGSEPSSEEAVPRRVGECVQTQIASLTSRLEGYPDSGSAVAYANGIYGVSYDLVEAVRRSQVGDSVTLCLVSEPGDCPKGDDRGKTYSAVNARTGEGWSLSDSAHMCGGA